MIDVAVQYWSGMTCDAFGGIVMCKTVIERDTIQGDEVLATDPGPDC